MSLDKINPLLSGLQPFEKIKPIRQEQPAGPGQGQGGFPKVLANAVREVDQIQKQANNEIEGLMLEKEGATAHGAMLALEKADIAFQLMNNIRMRIVRAYEEIMRQQV